MAGPYERETDTYDEPMPRAVHELHTAGRVRSGDRENLVRDTALGYLTAACQDAGSRWASTTAGRCCDWRTWTPQQPRW